MGKRVLAGASCALSLLCAPAFGAPDFTPDGVALMAGSSSSHGTLMAGTALVWDWDWVKRRRSLATAQTELIVAHWRADALGGGHQGLQQVTLLPVLRMQLQRGRSPWYLEVGIGASYLTRDYATPHKTFSTRWNFFDMIGAGYKFGAEDRHEIGLRVVHVSNLGIRKPNPGEDFVLLRYGYRF